MWAWWVGVGLGGRGRGGVEAVGQDGFDAAVAAGADVQRALAGGFHAGGRVASGQAQDSEARPVAQLGMRPVGHDRFDELGGGRSGAGCPGDQPFGVSG